MFGDGPASAAILISGLIGFLTVIALVLLIVTLIAVIRYLSLASSEIKARKRKETG